MAYTKQTKVSDTWTDVTKLDSDTPIGEWGSSPWGAEPWGGTTYGDSWTKLTKAEE